MDLAVGTGILLVEEGDALNPVRFNAIPLPNVYLDTGPDDKIDHVYRERSLKISDLAVAYPKGIISEKTIRDMQSEPDKKVKVLEVVCRNYSDLNEEKYDYYVINCDDREMIYYELFEGSGSNPYVCFRFSKASGEIYGRGPLINALSAIKTKLLPFYPDASCMIDHIR